MESECVYLLVGSDRCAVIEVGEIVGYEGGGIGGEDVAGM